MYCVKCGVRLSDGVEHCPLCRTPVWNPEAPEPTEKTFSDRYPTPPRSRRYPLLAFLTVLLLALCLSALIFCLKTLGGVYWSGYVMLGSALVYFTGIFPFWFERRPAVIYVPLSFALACGYLLYICVDTGGHWFLSFAFPVVMLVGLIATVCVILFGRIKRGRLLLTGCLLVVIGCSTMLVELFEAITFGTRMFTWSLYCVSGFSLIGLFLVLCALIRPWRDYLERKFFL
jgi:hypothetical protein